MRSEKMSKKKTIFNQISKVFPITLEMQKKLLAIEKSPSLLEILGSCTLHPKEQIRFICSKKPVNSHVSFVQNACFTIFIQIVIVI